VWDDLTPARVLSRASFHNAIAVAMALGCSTNAIIHLVALSRRAGAHCTIGLDDFDAASRRVPVIANIRPSGRQLPDAGLLRGRRPARAAAAAGAAPRSVGAPPSPARRWVQNIAGARVVNDDVIRPLDNPLYAEGALAVLRGNIAPGGAVIKPSACAPQYLQHTGPALVFDDYPALKAAVDDPDLDVTADHILVLRNAGPQGGPGMPEWGMLPIPTKLVKQGVRDMLRLSDARMSGTSYGACILHCAPEAYIGGPLALVRTGDRITVDVPARRIHLEVSDAELAARRAAWVPPPPRYARGYGWMASTPHPAGRRRLRLRLPGNRLRRCRVRARHLLPATSTACCCRT
jgi:dihydroxyacid dehydratase/phosphogluconate dehydratase